MNLFKELQLGLRSLFMCPAASRHRVPSQDDSVLICHCINFHRAKLYYLEGLGFNLLLVTHKSTEPISMKFCKGGGIMKPQGDHEAFGSFPFPCQERRISYLRPVETDPGLSSQHFLSLPGFLEQTEAEAGSSYRANDFLPRVSRRHWLPGGQGFNSWSQQLVSPVSVPPIYHFSHRNHVFLYIYLFTHGHYKIQEDFPMSELHYLSLRNIPQSKWLWCGCDTLIFGNLGITSTSPSFQFSYVDTQNHTHTHTHTQWHTSGWCVLISGMKLSVGLCSAARQKPALHKTPTSKPPVGTQCSSPRLHTHWLVLSVSKKTNLHISALKTNRERSKWTDGLCRTMLFVVPARLPRQKQQLAYIKCVVEEDHCTTTVKGS